MNAIKLYLGLDVHKDSITIAIAEAERNSELRLFISVSNDLDRLEIALNRIRKAHPGAQLECVIGLPFGMTPEPRVRTGPR